MARRCVDIQVPIADERFSLRFGGRWWTFCTAPMRAVRKRGCCLTPRRRKLPGFVIISTHLREGSPLELETIVHETLHAADRKLSEKRIRRLAGIVTRAITAYAKHGRG